MIYLRGNKRDYDRWEEIGNQNWNYEHVLKYFKKSEGNLNSKYVEYENGKYHSAHGPLLVKRFPIFPFTHIVRAAGKEFGIKSLFDLNSNETLGYGNLQGTIDGVRRVSTAKAFLVPAKHRPNLHIIKHALATKILFDDNKRAIGVDFEYNGKQNMTAYVNKEIIVSAGAIGSPQLLMLSGIGQKNHLDKFNIPTISDLPVGKNYFDHIEAYMFFKFKSRKQESPNKQLDDIYDYLLKQKGPLTSNGQSQLCGFVNTKKCGGYPDIQLFYTFYYRNSSSLLSLVTSLFSDKNIQKKLEEENQKSGIAVVEATLLQPKSRGSLDLVSSSPHEHPKIRPEFFSHPHDMKTLLRGVKQQIAFEETKAYKKNGGKFMHLPVEKCDQFKFKSDEYLECYIGYFSSISYHSAGKKGYTAR